MSSTSRQIAILYVSAVVLAAAFLVLAVVSTRRGRREGGTAVRLHRLERGEVWWAVAIVALLGALFGATWSGIPWHASAAGPTIKVEGMQFGFLVSPRTVPHGRVVFQTTSRDVNHGMGLYNARDELILQVQMIPGRTERQAFTLAPGTYTLRCLEFCGYGHHRMIYPGLEVTA